MNTSSLDFNQFLSVKYTLDEHKAIELQKEFVEANQFSGSDLPLISILLPVYNAEAYIETCILSLLHQTYQNIQIVIVNDGSKDGTLKLIENLALSNSKKINIINNDGNKGLIFSLNEGLKHCSGKYTARMDADDICMPNRIEKQYLLMESHSDLAAVCSWMLRFNKDQPLQTIKYSEDFQILKSNLFFYCPLPHPAAFFKTEIIQSLGYRNEYTITEDYDLWRRLFKYHKVSVVQEPLLMYRQHNEQVTQKGKNDLIFTQLQKVAQDLLSDIQLSVSPNEIKNHINYCMLDNNITSAKVFVELDTWFNKLFQHVVASNYIHTETFKNYIYTQRWVGVYMEFKNQFTLSERVLLRKSAFNKLSLKQQVMDTFFCLFNFRRT